MPILLDTNVYLFALRSAAGAEFFERRFLPFVFRTYLSCTTTSDGFIETLRVTPAMEARKSDHAWSLEEIAALAN